MTERIGYDSDTIGDIPGGAAVALVYADQVPTHTELGQLQARWPVVVLIDRGMGDPLGLGSVIDIEHGAHNVQDAPGWYDRKQAAGVEYRTVYYNRSNMASVEAVMGKRNHYRWISTLDGTMVIPEFPDAMVQFAPASAAGAIGTGHHADASVIRDDGWHPAPKVAHARLSAVGHEIAAAIQRL